VSNGALHDPRSIEGKVSRLDANTPILQEMARSVFPENLQTLGCVGGQQYAHRGAGPQALQYL
jgi:hypothetical protein